MTTTAKIELDEDSYREHYGSVNPEFAFASCSSTDGCPRQVGEFYNCRESLISSMRYKYYGRILTDICDTELWLFARTLYNSFVTSMKRFEQHAKADTEWMKNAEKVINIFERDLGFEPSTFERVVDPMLDKVKTVVFLIRGPQQWVSMPQMISIFVLLVRLSKSDIWNEFERMSDIDGVLLRAEKIAGLNSGTRLAEDARHLLRIGDNLALFLNNLQTLRGRRDNSKIFKASRGCHGISSLLDEEADAYTLKIWHKLKGEE